MFYNFEGYFGKRRTEEDDDKPSGPVTATFDYRKWQWHLMVEKIIKELNLTPNEVYEMNYIDCLNWLSMFNDRDKYVEMTRKNTM